MMMMMMMMNCIRPISQNTHVVLYGTIYCERVDCSVGGA